MNHDRANDFADDTEEDDADYDESDPHHHHEFDPDEFDNANDEGEAGRREFMNAYFADRQEYDEEY